MNDLENKSLNDKSKPKSQLTEYTLQNQCDDLIHELSKNSVDNLNDII